MQHVEERWTLISRTKERNCLYHHKVKVVAFSGAGHKLGK